MKWVSCAFRWSPVLGHTDIGRVYAPLWSEMMNFRIMWACAIVLDICESNLRDRIYRAKCYWLIFIFIDLSWQWGKLSFDQRDTWRIFLLSFRTFVGKLGLKVRSCWGASASSTPSVALQHLTWLMPLLILLFLWETYLDKLAYSFSSRKSHATKSPMLSVMLFCVVDINYLED